MNLQYITASAQKAALPLRHHAAKEALQRCLLAHLQKAGQLTNVAFIGGTALRLLHGLPRYSEDLDFMWVAPDRTFDINKWTEVLKSAFKPGEVTISIGKKERERVDALVEKYCAVIHLHAAASAFQTFARDGLQISFEIDLTPPDNFQKQFLPMDVAGERIEIPTLTLPSLMAGKLHILLTRADREKGRDWFDYIWYREHSILPNIAQLRSAIAQTAYGPDADYWSSFLRNRLKTVNWQNVRADVRSFLEDAESVKKLSAHHIAMLTPWPHFETIQAEVIKQKHDHLLFRPDGKPVLDDIRQAALEGELPAIEVLSVVETIETLEAAPENHDKHLKDGDTPPDR